MVSTLGDHGKESGVQFVVRQLYSYVHVPPEGSTCSRQPVAAQQFTGHMQNWLCIPVCVMVLAIVILGKSANFV